MTGNETTNTTVYDKYGNKVVVPAGFKIVNPNDDVTKGIVIEDVSAKGGNEYTLGSQFVWIPLGKKYIDENNNYKTINFGRYAFDAIYSDIEQIIIGSGKATMSQKAEDYLNETESYSFVENTLSTSSLYKECLKGTETRNAKSKDLESFIKKAIKSDGYYIGRYEAGDYTATDEPRKGNTYVSNSNNYVVCIV